MGEISDAADYNLLSYTGPGGVGVGVGGRDDARVSEWEIGLPSGDDLTPLSQSLIPPELASAFSISPEPEMTVQEVIRASHRTLSILRHSSSVSPLKSFSDDPMDVKADEPAAKLRRCNSPPPQASVSAADGESSGLIRPETALKRPRLVWTPQLHKRFVEVVAHVGIKSAVPKTIMQLMNVEGLTRENVASHLQKYRLYLKRMNGLSDEGPSSSDQLFASTPLPPTLQEPALPVPYAVPTMIPMPVYGVPHHRGHGPPMGMVPVVGSHHGFESHFGESLAKDRPGAGGSRIGSSVRYPGVRPNDN